jgi:hypothetical protein
MATDDAERLFDDNRSLIERLFAAIAGRYVLSPAEDDDFRAWAKARLVRDNYAVLRKFRGESAVSTYLSIVLRMLLREYRTAKRELLRQAKVPRPSYGVLKAEGRLHEEFGAEFGPTTPVTQLRDELWGGRNAAISMRQGRARGADLSGNPVLRVRITCAGVTVGTAAFQCTQGVAYADLLPTDAYALVAAPARAIGDSIACTQYWGPNNDDFADALSARWTGHRLAVEDELGRELAISSIVIADLGALGTTKSIRVIADFRPELARVDAVLNDIERSSGGSESRPAA